MRQRRDPMVSILGGPFREHLGIHIVSTDPRWTLPCLCRSSAKRRHAMPSSIFRWVMAFAGFWVAVGVNTFGYRVIRTMGFHLTSIDFLKVGVAGGVGEAHHLALPPLAYLAVSLFCTMPRQFYKTICQPALESDLGTQPGRLPLSTPCDGSSALLSLACRAT